MMVLQLVPYLTHDMQKAYVCTSGTQAIIQELKVVYNFKPTKIDCMVKSEYTYLHSYI